MGSRVLFVVILTHSDRIVHKKYALNPCSIRLCGILRRPIAALFSP